MIINNENANVYGNRIPVVRLVEPKITYEIEDDGTTVTYKCESIYEVNRNCILVGYCDRTEARNIFTLLQGMQELDFTALLQQHGVIKKIPTVRTSSRNGTPAPLSPEDIKELEKIVCVIIE